MGNACQTSIETCPGFADGDLWQTWVGLASADEEEGQGCCGCEVGKSPCRTDPDIVGQMHASTDGKRWVRASEVAESRDALGRLHDLRSNVPHHAQPVQSFDMAPCHDEFGNECYDRPDGLCRCDDNQYECTPGGVGCGNGSGNPCSAFYPDSFTTYGGIWGNGIEQLSCRFTYEREERTIRVDSNKLMNALFLRNGFKTPSRKNNCTSNRMAVCGGQGYGDPCSGNDETGFYMGPDHVIWNFATIGYSNLSIETPSELRPAAAAAMHARNQAIAAAVQLPSLSQIDYEPSLIGNFNTSANNVIDSWVRSWGVGASCEQRQTEGHIATWDNCTLRGSGCLVVVDYFIREATIEMGLVAHKTLDYPVDADDADKLWPSVRFRLNVKMGMTARLVDSPCLSSRNWRAGFVTLGIENPDCTVPVVTPLGEDQILFVDNQGRAFVPPMEADWWGYHGEYGVPKWQPIIYSENANVVNKCCELAYRLDGLQVNGWPRNLDGDATIYNGSIRLGFVTSNWCGSCLNQGLPVDCDDGGGGGKYIPPVGEQPRGISARPIGGPQLPPIGFQPFPVPPAVDVPGGPIINPPDLVPSPFPPASEIPGGPVIVPPVLRPQPVPPVGAVPTDPIINPPDNVQPAPPRQIPVDDGLTPIEDPPIRRPPDKDDNLIPRPAPPPPPLPPGRGGFGEADQPRYWV